MEYYKYNAMDCPICKGKGKLDTRLCPACHGTGTVPEVKKEKDEA